MAHDRAGGEGPPRRKRVEKAGSGPLAFDAEAALAAVAEQGLVAAIERPDLHPAELALLELLTEFGDAVPGASRAAQVLGERKPPKPRTRYRIADGVPE
jgi:hypothetical protein